MDYIFYRIYTYYKKKDYIPVVMSINFLFVVGLALYFLFGVIFNLLTGGLFSNQGMKKEMFMSISIFIFISLYVFNVYRYVRRGKIESIITQFENSPLNQKIKTWQVFIIPILIVVFSILLVVLFK